MRKVIALLLAIMLLCTCGCAGLPATETEEPAEKVVGICAPEGFIPQAVLDGFTAETGINVRLYTLGSAEELIGKLDTGVCPFDLIIADNLYLEKIAAEKDLLTDIDRTKLENGEMVVPGAMQMLTEQTSACLIPYTRTCAVLLHNLQYTQSPVVAYDSLWSAPLLGKVSLVPDARLMCAVALKRATHSVNSVETYHLQEAEDALCSLKPNVYSFSNMLAHDEVVRGLSGVSVVWAEDAQKAYENNAMLEVLYPREGGIVKMNCIAMSASAPNSEEAMQLLDYLLRAENSIAISKHLRHESLHTAAAELTEPEYADMIAVHMSAKYDLMTECMHYVTDEQTYDAIWNTFKSYEIEAEE